MVVSRELILIGVGLLMVMLAGWVVDRRRRFAKPSRRASPEDIGKRETLWSKLVQLIGSNAEPSWSLIEATLLQADVGVKTTVQLIERLRATKTASSPERRQVLARHLRAILAGSGKPLSLNARPTVLLVVGVNGVGKTTTIGKLSWQVVRAGKRVVLAAADTFRAAAAEQLQVWAERAGARVVAQKPGAAPSAVAYDAIQSAISAGEDLVIVDTAGRLQTKNNLMAELEKVRRGIGKACPGAPHETWLVLDATLGQNAVSQAREFHQVVGLTGLIMTKLDSLAKGGVLFAICTELRVPIRYVGVGEGIDALQLFDADSFVEKILSS